MVIEDFNKLQFHSGEIPDFMIDFIDYITGTKGFYLKCLNENLAINQMNMSRNSRNGAHNSDQQSNNDFVSSYGDNIDN